MFAVADDLLPLLTVLAFTLALATIAEGQAVLAIETIGLGLCGVAVIGPRLRRQSLPAWVPDVPRLTIAVANVFVDNPTPQRTAAELVHSGVEVIVINELTDRFLECIDELGGDVWFPHRIVDVGGDPEYTTAVFSRRPFGEGSGVVVAPVSLRLIRAEFDVDGTPLTLLATHLEANIGRGGHPRWRGGGCVARRRRRTSLEPHDHRRRPQLVDRPASARRPARARLHRRPRGARPRARPVAEARAARSARRVRRGGARRPSAHGRRRAGGRDHAAARCRAATICRSRPPSRCGAPPPTARPISSARGRRPRRRGSATPRAARRGRSASSTRCRACTR